MNLNHGLNEVIKILEKSLYKPIKEKYGKNYNAYYEIRLYSRIVDILFVRKRSTYPIIAMEFKVKDWKKALIQGYSYFLIANYVYIVLYYKSIKFIEEKDLEIFRKNGIGLISSSTKKYEIILKPRKNKFIDQELSKKIIKNLN